MHAWVERSLWLPWPSHHLHLPPLIHHYPQAVPSTLQLPRGYVVRSPALTPKRWGLLTSPSPTHICSKEAWDSVMLIGNNTSKSEASIQRVTALNAGGMENLATDQLEAVQQREHRDTRDFLCNGTSSRRRCQYQEENKRANIATIRRTKPIVAFCYNIVRKLQDWCSTSHGNHTPLQDDGNKPMMDLAQSLQTWCARADEEELTVAQRPSWYSDTYPGTETETDSCQRWSWTSRRMCKAEWNQGTVDDFWVTFSRWTDHDSNEQSNKQKEILWTDWRQVVNWRKTFKRPRMCDDERERTDTLSGPFCACARDIAVASKLWNGQDAVDQAWKRRVVETRTSWETCSARAHWRKWTRNLSTTSWKMKLTGRRKNRVIRWKMVSKKRSDGHTRWHETWDGMSADPNLSRAYACN